MVQKDRQLLAQRLVAFGLVAGHHGALEQRFLDLARQLAPARQHGPPEGALEVLGIGEMSGGLVHAEPPCEVTLMRAAAGLCRAGRASANVDLRMAIPVDLFRVGTMT
jgi:hypothetical protein